MLVNLGLAAYIVGNVTQLVTQSDEHTRMFRTSFRDLQKYCDTNGLPAELCEDLRSYMLLRFNAREEHREARRGG